MNVKSIRKQVKYRRLAGKLIFSMVIVSSLLTLLITAFQLYRDYAHEMNMIEQRFAQIQSVNVPSIAQSLWKTDDQELMLQLDGLSRLPYMQYLVIKENNKIIVERGEFRNDANTMSRTYPLTFRHRNEELYIGEFRVVITLDDIYQDLIDKIWIILVSNAFKTFMVAGFVLFIFQYLVTRHIVSLASQLKDIDIADLNKPIDLHRTDNPGNEEDELDVLVHAFNDMRQKISDSFQRTIRREEYLTRYESILAGTKDMMAYIDRNYTYRAINQAYSDVLGKSQDEIIGYHVDKFPGNEYIRKYAKPNLDRTFGGEHVLLNTRLQNKDGKWIDIEVNFYPHYDAMGRIRGAVVNARDISERVAAEKERSRNAQVYKTLAQQGAVDFPEFVLNSLKLLQSVFGAKFSMVGKLLPKTMKIQTITVLEFGNVTENFIYDLKGTPCERVYDKSREIVYAGVADKYPEDAFLKDIDAESYFGFPLFDTRGFVVGLLVIIDDKPHNPQSWHEDILSAFAARLSVEMERADVLAKLENYNAELESRVKQRTSELESSIRDHETFSYSVSHDLRTPLRAINGYSRLLKEDLQDVIEENAHSYLDNIVQASERMNMLIDSLLRLSRIGRQALEIENINLSDLANNAISDSKDDRLEEIDFVIEENMYCHGDKNLLQIAIDNLISNAIKYTSKNPHPEIELGTLKKEGETVYFIKDNGVGFDERYSERLFEPFQRLHDETEFQGLGIGLATVSRIFNRHGGHIWAESKGGDGATFYFTLGEMKKYEVA